MFKGGVLPGGFILARYYGLSTNISFTFQAVQNLCSGLFWKFFGDFWLYLEIESFSQRISKIMEIVNFEDMAFF